MINIIKIIKMIKVIKMNKVITMSKIIRMIKTIRTLKSLKPTQGELKTTEGHSKHLVRHLRKLKSNADNSKQLLTIRYNSRQLWKSHDNSNQL